VAGELCAGATCALQLWCKSLGPHKKRGALTTFDSLMCSPFNTLAMVFFTPEPHGREIFQIFLRPVVMVCKPASTTHHLEAKQNWIFASTCHAQHRSVMILREALKICMASNFCSRCFASLRQAATMLRPHVEH